MTRIVDWSVLPPELLQFIAKKLADIADYVRFGAVCTSWRQSASPGNLPPQLPWLMLPSNSATEHRLFYSLSSGRVYTIHLPEAHDKRIQGSSHGWVVSLNRAVSISLLNPLTGAQIQLPPLISGSSSIRAQTKEELLRFLRSDIFISSPGSNSECLVVYYVASRRNPGFAFCRPGDKKWTVVVDAALFSGFTYYKGKFVAVSGFSRISTIDAGTLATASMAMPSVVINCLDRIYLLVSSSDELLMVIGIFLLRERARFQVFKLDQSEQQRWVEVTSIGDNMIFLDVYHAIFFAATGVAGLRKNCIYFLDNDRVGNPIFGGPELCHIFVFNIGDGSVERLPFHWDKFPNAWFEATWVAPSLS